MCKYLGEGDFGARICDLDGGTCEGDSFGDLECSSMEPDDWDFLNGFCDSCNGDHADDETGTCYFTKRECWKLQ